MNFSDAFLSLSPKSLLLQDTSLRFEASSDPATLYASIERAARGIDPDALKELTPPATPSTPIAQQARALLKERPLTIVIFPGIFGEFIETRAFEEVFSNTESTSAKLWARKVRRSRVTDPSPSLKGLTAPATEPPLVDVPIADLFSVASIDDKDGYPLVTLVLFRTAPLSFETLGTLEGNARVFLRRLQKFYSVYGTPDDVAYLGYSRGAVVALEALSQSMAQQASQESLPVSAMISLGGVLYGTPLADLAFNAHHVTPEPPTAKLLGSLTTLAEGLELNDRTTLERDGYTSLLARTTEGFRRVGRNTDRWLTFLAALAESQGKSVDGFWNSVSAYRQLLDEFSKQNQGADPAAAVQMAVAQAMRFGMFTGFGDAFTDAAATKYSSDIVRFKAIVQAILAGVTSLTTEARFNWWRTHSLPDVPYYALSATMGQRLKGDARAFNPSTPDDNTLAKSYSDFYAASELAANDSQVSIAGSRFWPELSTALNPTHAHLRTEFLGLLGTHHWGLALQIVNANENHTLNPFPRKEMLLAIAAKVVSELP